MSALSSKALKIEELHRWAADFRGAASRCRWGRGSVRSPCLPRTCYPLGPAAVDHVVVCGCSGAPTGAHLWDLTTHPAARVWIAEGGSMNRHIRLAAFVTLAACSSTKKGPVLTSLSPATGTVGTVVTIDGTGFAQNGTTNPKVTFVPVAGGNSTDAVVQAFSATALDVKVPDVGALAAGGTA